MDIKFHCQVRCSCGWALEEDTDAVPYLGTVTVKPCPICTGKAKWPKQEDTGTYNRRGVTVSERST